MKYKMKYKDAYLYLFNELTNMMQRHVVLREEIIRMQQQAEDIILSGDEDDHIGA